MHHYHFLWYVAVSAGKRVGLPGSFPSILGALGKTGKLELASQATARVLVRFAVWEKPFTEKRKQ
jgi:hypothetical protein